MLLINLIYFAISCAVLLLAAELVVLTLSRLSGYLKISEYIAAFILMAIATSVPELFVGISSSLSGKGSIVLGTIIGANLLNLTLVLGIPIIITGGIRVTSKVLKKDVFYMFIISCVPPLLMLIGDGLSRIDGVILIILFGVYGWQTIRARKGFHKRMQQRLSHWDAIKTTLIFAASIITLFFAADYAVKYATTISTALELPPILIGLLIISIGTTLPELFVGIRAARTKHASIVVGDVIGSVVTNSTLVIGIAALIRPIQAHLILFLTSTAFMLLAAFLVSTFAESGKKLYQKEGVALIMLYMLFLIVEMNLRGMF